MPIYEYQCRKNPKHVFESVQPFTHSDYPQPCPECKKAKPHSRALPVMGERIMSVTAAPKFKAGGAGGFYKPNA